MPTYGYECKSCGHTFDVFQSIKDEPLKSCPECSMELRRLINGGTGVIFKGGGFYVTDKSKTSAAKTASSPKESPSSESTPCQGCPKSDSSGAAGPDCPKAANS